jgi:rubrerythrin
VYEDDDGPDPEAEEEVADLFESGDDEEEDEGEDDFPYVIENPIAGACPECGSQLEERVNREKRRMEVFCPICGYVEDSWLSES